MKVNEVHYRRGPSSKRRSETDPIVSVCKPAPWPGGLGSVLITLLPRLVTCPSCLAWMADHYRDVIAAVNKLRSVAA